MPDASEAFQMREARSRFAAMAGAYFMGTFNDNFFKQAVMLIAVTAGRKDLQGIVVLAFTAPFVVLAAPAGWLADRFPKRSVVIAAKSMELMAAFVGLAGLVTGHLGLMVGMVGLMGLQATFFSPALNGAIPELFPPARVTWANGILRMLVTTGILVGITLAGFVLDIGGAPLLSAPRGRVLVGVMVVAISALGLLVSFGIPRRNAADATRRFPWTGPVETVRELRAIWRDRQLGRILVADVFLWSAGAFQLILINTLGKEQFGLSDSLTSLLVAAQMLGLAVGGLLAAHFSTGSRWFRVLLPAGLGMALAMGLVSLVPVLPAALRIPSLYGLIGLAGAAGGLFLIPCESFLQIRPAPERKGAVWAAANFASFSGMAVASVVYIALKSLKPSSAYGVLGAMSLLITAWLYSEFRREEWR